MAENSEASPCVTIAAAGDVHARAGLETRLADDFSSTSPVDLILLAGDLTATGSVAEARLLADASRSAAAPIVAVLGNHDYHLGRHAEITELLTAAGMCVLDGGATSYNLRGMRVGIVGAKGFVGGFLDSRLPDFGEPLLRQVYAETGKEVEAIDEGLQAIADCDVRIVLLHYAPTTTTLEGERETLWTFLGSERLAAPIARWQPDIVLHGHAHAGYPEGAIGSTPVLNVAQPVLAKSFRTITLSPRGPKNHERPELPAPTRAG